MAKAQFLTGTNGHQTMTCDMVDQIRSNKQISNMLFGMPLGKNDPPELICEKIEMVYKVRLNQLKNLEVYHQHNAAKCQARAGALAGLGERNQVPTD